MAKKARIVHNSSEQIDFAPGIHNIIKRTGNVCYYAVETFHSSPFWNRITPIFAADVHSSGSLTDIYGAVGLRAQYDNVVLLNNHPIRKVRMVGRITEYFIKEIGPNTFYFVSVDDSSGHEIVCKVLKAKLLGAGLKHFNCEGVLIELVGLIHTYNRKYELHVDSLSILNNGEEYFREELAFWKDAFQIRSILKTPWIQSAQLNNDDVDPVYKIDEQTQKRKLIQNDIRLNSLRQSDSPGLVLDSSIYIRKKTVKHIAEDVDSSDTEESELEEDNDSVFEKRKLLPLYLNRPRSLDKSWVSITNFLSNQQRKHDLDTEVIIAFMKWILKNNESKFNLNKPYKDPKIADLLRITAQRKFPIQVVDLTVPDGKIKTVNEIHGELFHQARHALQVAQLIRCTRSKNCNATIFIDFFTRLRKSLSLAKENFLILKLDNFIQVYNNNNGVEIGLDFKILQLMVYWLLSKENDQNWRYNVTGREWVYYKSDRILKA